MATEIYQSTLQQLTHLVQQADQSPDFSHRFMFGGVGLYSRGVFFGILMAEQERVWILLKLPAEGREALNTGEALPESPVSKQYAVIPSSIALDDDQMIAWLNKSLTYCYDLAVKGKKKKK